MHTHILWSQHCYCNSHCTDENHIPRLSILHEASEKQCWHLNLNLFLPALCSRHYRRHLLPQSQIHPLTGGGNQQPQVNALILANCFTNECCLDDQEEHRGEKRAVKVEHSSPPKKKNLLHCRKYQLISRKHIFCVHTQHCCRINYQCTELDISGAHNLCQSYYILNTLEELATEKNSVIKCLCKVKNFFTFSKSGVPNLQDLMPDDLRRSWCHNNRNKVHQKCNILVLSANQPTPPTRGKKCPPRNWSLVPKRQGTAALNLWIFKSRHILFY